MISRYNELAANEAVGILRSAKSSRSSQIRGSIPARPVIEVPYAGWRQVHIGNPSAIDIASENEERGLRFVLWNESSRHYETTGLRPTMRTMLELGHLPMPVDRFIG